MVRKVALVLLFVSLAVWCQTVDSDVAEEDFWRPRRSIEVTSPNGGESWHIDSTYNITWKSRGWISFVKIEYSTDGDSTWNFITRRTRNNGFYSWEVPDTPSDYCKVRVSALFGPVSDESDSAFSIVSDSTPPDSSYIIVMEPNGGETWYTDRNQYILWYSYNTSGTFKIEYTLNASDSVGGDSLPNWITITDSATDSLFVWYVPPEIYSHNCLIRITDVDGYPSDESDYSFTIMPRDSVPPDTIPYLEVISPDGGELWYTDTVNYINWSARNTSGIMKIEYTLDAYDSLDQDSIPDWITITDSTTDSIYAWLTPSDIYSHNCLIRVTDVDGSPSDESDYPFTIMPRDSVPPDTTPYLRVITPNGGEIWHTDTTNYINWNARNTSGKMKIEYTLNAYDTLTGDSMPDWITITDSTTDSIFAWFTPSGIYSHDCLIRVTDVDGSPSDVSDYPFSIIPPDSMPPDTTPSDSFPPDSNVVQAGINEIPKSYSMVVNSINRSSKLVIKYGIPKTASIKLVVYDIMGAKIEDISDKQSAGFYSTELDLQNKPGGVYFVRIQANGNEFVKTSKVLMLK